MQVPFIGPSYRLNTAFDGQRTVNMYIINSETGNSKAKYAFQGTPGLLEFVNLPNTPIRGEFEVNGRGFAVAANKLYEIFIDGTYLERGTLNSNLGAISMSSNGFQLCMVDGPDGYIFTLATDVFAEITDPYFLGANTVTFDSGYFIFNKPDSQIYYISSLYDGLTGDPLDFASAEGSPDFLVAVVSVHQQVWLLGSSTTQIVSNTGGADFPYSTVPGSLIQYGCAAAFSIAQTANTLFWLGQDANGNGMVWSTNGYAPIRISTHAIEQKIQSIGDISGAVAYAYQEKGYYFYVLNIPGLDTSLVYEVGTQQWHERGGFENGAYYRNRPNCHMFIYNSHLVGDFEEGKIYKQSLDYLDNDGENIRRMRVSPHYFDDNVLDYIYYNQFQLDMQVGIGSDGGTSGEEGSFSDGFSDGFDIGSMSVATDQNVVPQLMLQYSDDGGYTWSNERWESAGRIGEYTQRVVWRRLGRSRNRVFKVVFDAARPVIWNNAYIRADKGMN